jgi:selenide,water dikinase
VLRQAVKGLKQPADPHLLVGFDKADDAGVYQISPDLALIQTVDFFTPIVDDPVWFGRIAAANSLSDVYAMGGKPLTALNVFCVPEDLDPQTIGEILQGGLEKMIEARCTLVGGHSVKDPELKYGLSVTGTINPNRIFSNDKAHLGQALVLTKKLGTGIVTTAAKFEDCSEELLNEAIEQMSWLNEKACEAMLKTDATSCTDITGFGFLGHLSEMTRASSMKAVINASQIPYFKGLEKLIADEYVTRGDKTNREYAEPVIFNNVDKVMQSILFDPQTSGGLLISMSKDNVEKFQSEMKKIGQESWLVGEITAKDPKGTIEVIG